MAVAARGSSSRGRFRFPGPVAANPRPAVSWRDPPEFAVRTIRLAVLVALGLALAASPAFADITYPPPPPPPPPPTGSAVDVSSVVVGILVTLSVFTAGFWLVGRRRRQLLETRTDR